MWITRNEAVEMYARFLQARHKNVASKLARKTANSLESRGDLDGHRIWNEVADVIDRRDQGSRQHTFTIA